MNFNYFIDNVDSNEHYCVGVMFNELCENQKNMIFSEMMKYRYEHENTYFYIFTENLTFYNFMLHHAFRGYIIPHFLYETERIVFSHLKNIIASFEYSKYSLPENKNYIFPSEESFVFNFSEKQMIRFA